MVFLWRSICDVLLSWDNFRKRSDNKNVVDDTYPNFSHVGKCERDQKIRSIHENTAAAANNARNYNKRTATTKHRLKQCSKLLFFFHFDGSSVVWLWYQHIEQKTAHRQVVIGLVMYKSWIGFVYLREKKRNNNKTIIYSPRLFAICILKKEANIEAIKWKVNEHSLHCTKMWELESH